MAIDSLAARGVIEGFDDGSFRPDLPVTRQQFAKMIIGALGLPATTADVCRFSDVAASAGEGLYPDHFVAVAAANGITEGYTDGSFGPLRQIERTHAVTMVVRALTRIYPTVLAAAPSAQHLPGEWDHLPGEHLDAAMLAYAVGLLENTDLAGTAHDARAPMPRGEVAQVLYNMIRLLPEVPEFQTSVEPLADSLRAVMLESGSWRPAVPVSQDGLRLLRVSFWGFDGRAHDGSMVVSALWAERLRGVFRSLYEARFPIRSMNLIDEYGASDERSMSADNSSAFNGRYVSGTSSWSMHAFGLAIDINPIENPWVRGAEVSPPAGRSFVDRSKTDAGMIHRGDVVVRAFASIGWKWGGDWSGSKDYQHFSSNGR